MFEGERNVLSSLPLALEAGLYSGDMSSSVLRAERDRIRSGDRSKDSGALEAGISMDDRFQVQDERPRRPSRDLT